MDRSSQQDEKLSANILAQKKAGLLTENWSRLWSSLIIDELVQQKLDHFYISPGLRNAPLIAAVVYHPQATSYNGIDERALAYRALGHAKATGRAAVLICTSGTALANYMPALIEANKSGHPMMVLSADRPVELTVSDANQSIDQNHFYGNHVEYFLNLGGPTAKISVNAVRTSIANMANNTRFPFPAPVHINCPFREPLDQTDEFIPASYLKLAAASFAARHAQTEYINAQLVPQETHLAPLRARLSAANNPLLVVGGLSPHRDHREIARLLDTITCNFYVDIGSSFKYKYCLNDRVVPSFDHREVYDYFNLNPPDLIIHLGGRLVSKFYYQFLENNPAIPLISINNRTHKEDPSHSTNTRIIAEPNLLAKDWNEQQIKLRGTAGPGPSWSKFILLKRELIERAPLTYPMLSKTLIEIIPNHSALYLGNSTVVRSFDSYASLSQQKDIKVLTNRGASGIEGFVASACGFCDGNGDLPLTLILGDISLLHDLNSLHLLKDLAHPMVIVVVNNHGGGIFTLLPVAQEELIIQQLTTPHNLNFAPSARQFNLAYTLVQTADQFQEAYKVALQSQKSHIIEASIDNQENTTLYQQLKTVRL